MGQGKILAIDLGARHLGWAVNIPSNVGAAYGLIDMPGTEHPGQLYAATRNELERLIVRYQPTIIRFVQAFIARGEDEREAQPGKAAKARKRFRTSIAVQETSLGQQAILKCAAWDNSLELQTVNERAARKQVLGTCDFGLIDPRTGGIVPDSGRKEAKRHVMEWCAAQGYLPKTHDVGDALVLLAYDPARKPARTARAKHQPQPTIF